MQVSDGGEEGKVFEVAGSVCTTATTEVGLPTVARYNSAACTWLEHWIIYVILRFSSRPSQLSLLHYELMHCYDSGLFS